ncbi:MAG: YbhB/YbcL family Raf kinase inhibitor-like protein [Cyanobacteriota bacterium]|nr:YbhB/YbcL family Raf kinase inhibitor-like protein [Cyanobacteriota bacterium]
MQECGNGALRLYSPAFQEGALIPQLYTGDGLDLSPPLKWLHVPSGCSSFCLMMEDPDAPLGCWLHWLLFNIPAETRELAAGIDRRPLLEDGARHGRSWGVNHYERTGYYGPLPPQGSVHRYTFTLRALDCLLGLSPGVTREQVLSASENHCIAEDVLTAIYGR